MNTQIAQYMRKAGLTANDINKLCGIGYFSQPASKGHHLAERGGLVTHSINVTRRLCELTDALGVIWPRPESPYLVGMLHDLVKCRCYRVASKPASATGDEPPKWEYVQPPYPGHGAASVAIAAELGIQLKKNEIIAITFHMGQFGVGREYTQNEFDAAMKECGSMVIATHFADWYAARVDEEGDR